MVTRKLTTLEQRAANYMRDYRIDGMTEQDFICLIVEWSRSNHASIKNHRDERMAQATGGGYCKVSTVLSQVLCWLFNSGTPEHNKIARLEGHGVSTVRAEMEKLGYDLREMRGSTDTFILRKAQTV